MDRWIAVGGYYQPHGFRVAPMLTVERLLAIVMLLSVGLNRDPGVDKPLRLFCFRPWDRSFS